MNQVRSLLLSAALAAVISLIAPAAAACGGALAGPGATQRDEAAGATPLIPRAALFGNPDRAAPKLSPDGRYLSYLAPLDGVLNVFVAPVDALDRAEPVTHDRGRGVRMYFWAYTSRDIIYVQDQRGDENWNVYRVDIKTGDVRNLTPFENTSARVQEVSPERPSEILVALNNRVPEFHDIHRVNIDTGEMRPVRENDEFFRIITDDNYQVRLALRTTPEGGMQILEAHDDGRWTTFGETSMEDMITTDILGFNRRADRVYMLDSRGRNTSALVSIDMETGESTELASDRKADIDGVLRHPVTREPQAAWSTRERRRWMILDDRIHPDFEYLRSVADGELEVTSRTLDESCWVVAFILDDQPVHYYLYDRAARNATFLFSNRQALDGLPLASMNSTIVTSRDGLGLVTYWLLPVGADADGDGHPLRPAPTILLVHGGPWARDRWGYSPTAQWLANRGYAVLMVNFRGSTGFGKEFVNAGNLEWAGRMHDDLIDTIDWAIREGIADPEKVAIMGGSYGGYAALVGLTFTPDRFACAVDIVGPSNLVTLLEDIPPYWKPMIEFWAAHVGDPRTEEGRELLESRSPLNFIDRIKRPLLIGQGANDPRVKQSESDQIVDAMRAKMIPVTYVLYPDEGHGFARPENRLSFFAIAEAFLSRHLGGRYEPMDSDLSGSTLEVVEGADEIPGLLEALRPAPSPAPAKK